MPSQIEYLTEEHAKELDRLRETHRHYEDQLKERYNGQIEQMQDHSRQMEQHFDHSVQELRTLHAQETERLDQQNMRLRRGVKTLVSIVVIENGIFLLLLILDVINRSIGWMR